MGVDLQSPRAQSLRISLALACETLEKAQVGYREALAIYLDTVRSDDGVFALRREGRVYAHAVTQHSAAVMAWLAFVDGQLHHHGK